MTNHAALVVDRPTKTPTAELVPALDPGFFPKPVSLRKRILRRVWNSLREITKFLDSAPELKLSANVSRFVRPVSATHVGSIFGRGLRISYELTEQRTDGLKIEKLLAECKQTVDGNRHGFRPLYVYTFRSTTEPTVAIQKFAEYTQKAFAQVEEKRSLLREI